VEEVPHFIDAHRPILVGIHCLEDAGVSGLKLLQGHGSVAIAIHQRKNYAHRKRPHHTSLSYGVPHRALSRHVVPAHALAQTLSHHSVAAYSGFALIHAVLLRLLKLLHVCGVGIVLGAGDYTAANENGCGGCYQEKMPFHRSLLYGYRTGR
jgi:hypothetical protein